MTSCWKKQNCCDCSNCNPPDWTYCLHCQTQVLSLMSNGLTQSIHWIESYLNSVTVCTRCPDRITVFTKGPHIPGITGMWRILTHFPLFSLVWRMWVHPVSHGNYRGHSLGNKRDKKGGKKKELLVVDKQESPMSLCWVMTRAFSSFLVWFDLMNHKKDFGLSKIPFS